MSHIFRPVVLVATVLVAAADVGVARTTKPGDQSEPAQSGQTPLTVFRSEVDIVAADVTVVDKDGKPVTGLLAPEFTVRVDGKPRRIVSVVEGESLVNDGTGLVLYRVAVAAVVTGSFSALYTGGLFVVSALGGILVGLVVGQIVRQVRLRLDNPPAEITISLLTGYFAFIPAELRASQQCSQP